MLLPIDANDKEDEQPSKQSLPRTAMTNPQDLTAARMGARRDGPLCEGDATESGPQDPTHQSEDAISSDVVPPTAMDDTISSTSRAKSPSPTPAHDEDEMARDSIEDDQRSIGERDSHQSAQPESSEEKPSEPQKDVPVGDSAQIDAPDYSKPAEEDVPNVEKSAAHNAGGNNTLEQEARNRTQSLSPVHQPESSTPTTFTPSALAFGNQLYEDAPEWPEAFKVLLVIFIVVIHPALYTWHHFWCNCSLSWYVYNDMRSDQSVQVEQSQFSNSDEVEDGNYDPEASKALIDTLEERLLNTHWIRFEIGCLMVTIAAISSWLFVLLVVVSPYFRANLVSTINWCSGLWATLMGMGTESGPDLERLVEREANVTATAPTSEAPSLCRGLLDQAELIPSDDILAGLVGAWRLATLDHLLLTGNSSLNNAFRAAVDTYRNVNNGSGHPDQDNIDGLDNPLYALASKYRQTKKELSRYDALISGEQGVQAEILKLIAPANATAVGGASSAAETTSSGFITWPALSNGNATGGDEERVAINVWECCSPCVLKSLELVVATRPGDHPDFGAEKELNRRS